MPKVTVAAEYEKDTAKGKKRYRIDAPDKGVVGSLYLDKKVAGDPEEGDEIKVTVDVS